MREIQLVLVDDEQLQLDYMQQLLEELASELNLKLQIFQYSSAEAFLFALEDHPSWDLAFLDIEMKLMNGMELAKIIRQKAPDMQIVFATAYAEYAIEGYSVQALDYLLKPIKKINIRQVLERLLNQKNTEAAFIVVEYLGEMQRIELDELLYIEALGREVKLKLPHKELLIKEGLAEITDKLDERFIKTHRSYVVNLEYVSRLQKNDVVLSTNETIPLSRRLAKSVQSAFIDFYKGSVFYDD